MRTVIFTLFLLMSRLVSAAPFTMNGWQFHERDVPKLAEAVKKAPEYGVNFFIFSHGFFHSVEEFLNLPGRQRDVLYIGSLADQQKISWYLWIHELDDIPQRFREGKRVNLDDPALIPYLQNRYERLLAKCPNSAGLVLTLHESNNKVFRDSEVKSKLSVPNRIRLIARLVYDVARKHDKKFILRNFFYEPKEMEYFAEAITTLPDDIIIMSKDTTHEFDPWYPPDPLHGKVGKKLQIMECDLGVEKAWSGQGHYAQVEYIQRYVRRARTLGLAGAVGRARLFWDHPFEDTHEINLYAFSRFMKEPDLDVDTVLLDWARRRYPAEAAPFIASAMKRTEFIQHHGRWFLGFWLTKSIGDEWGDYPYYFGHILLRSRYKWTKDPADKELEGELYSPGPALFAKLVAEKDEVIKQVLAGMADINDAARYLTPEQAEPLREGFRYLLDAAGLEKEWTRAFFSQRMWMKEPSEEHAMVVNDALAKLEAMDRFPGVAYGLNPRTGHRYNIDKFVLEMRWRMANRTRALEEDTAILQRTVRATEVDRN
jgi:hypothetical protein